MAQPEKALLTRIRGHFMPTHLADLSQCLVIPLDIRVDILNDGSVAYGLHMNGGS